MADNPIPAEIVDFMRMQRWGTHHVHWHVVPLPPGVPFEEQQLAALDTDLGFDLSEEELEALRPLVASGCVDLIEQVLDEVVLLAQHLGHRWLRLVRHGAALPTSVNGMLGR